MSTIQISSQDNWLRLFHFLDYRKLSHKKNDILFNNPNSVSLFKMPPKKISLYANTFPKPKAQYMYPIAKDSM